jgi:Schlafen, AlbA_2
MNGFLNTEGGELFFGVADDGTVKGLPLDRPWRDEIRNQIDMMAQRCKPAIDPQEYTLSFLPVCKRWFQYAQALPDTVLIRIRVFKATRREVYMTRDRKAYMKRDASIREMTADIVAQRTMDFQRENVNADIDRLIEARLARRSEEIAAAAAAAAAAANVNVNANPPGLQSVAAQPSGRCGESDHDVAGETPASDAKYDAPSSRPANRTASSQIGEAPPNALHHQQRARVPARPGVSVEILQRLQPLGFNEAQIAEAIQHMQACGVDVHDQNVEFFQLLIDRLCGQ